MIEVSVNSEIDFFVNFLFCSLHKCVTDQRVNRNDKGFSWNEKEEEKYLPCENVQCIYFPNLNDMRIQNDKLSSRDRIFS